MGLTILDPTAERSPTGRPLSSRLERLDGKVIGLLDIRKARGDVFLDRVADLLTIPGDEVVRGAGGIAEGLPAGFEGSMLPKFRDGGLLLVHAGGGAGLFSSIIGGWANGDVGSQPVTVEVAPWA